MKPVENKQNLKNELLLQCAVNNPGLILQQAIAEDSNIVLDWLWCAKQVKSDAELRYCFERALYINPKNQTALDGLTALNRKQTILSSRKHHLNTNLAGLLQAWMRMPVLPSSNTKI